MLSLYLIRSKVVFNGKGFACHWDFVRRKKKIACAIRSIPTSVGNYSSIGQTFIRDSEAKIRKTDYQSPLPSVGDIFFRAVSR